MPPCAATWYSRDPVTCLYMCMSVNYLSCMRQVTTHEVMLHHDIQLPFLRYGPMAYFFSYQKKEDNGGTRYSYIYIYIL